MPIFQTEVANKLLRSIPPEEFHSIQDQLQWRDLRLHDVLQKPKTKITVVVFPVKGLVSLLAVTATGVRTEVGIVGNEGFAGIPLMHEVDLSPYQAIVQVDGQALTISADNLLAASSRCPQLRSNLLRFAHIFEVQISQTALCNGHFKIENRLARWLLMCSDRVESPSFIITHEFLSVMLAVRRSGVTVALQELEGKKIIRSTRAKVEILNREALLEIAGGAYGVPEAEYTRLFS